MKPMTAMTNETTVPLSTQMAFKNFDFYYGKFHALKNINLEIYQRHVTAFIGPSGCGKSTLLRAMNRKDVIYIAGGHDIRHVGNDVLDSEVESS